MARQRHVHHTKLVNQVCDIPAGAAFGSHQAVTGRQHALAQGFSHGMQATVIWNGHRLILRKQRSPCIRKTLPCLPDLGN